MLAYTGLLRNQGEKGINLYFIMAPLRKEVLEYCTPKPSITSCNSNLIPPGPKPSTGILIPEALGPQPCTGKVQEISGLFGPGLRGLGHKLKVQMSSKSLSFKSCSSRGLRLRSHETCRVILCKVS